MVKEKYLQLNNKDTGAIIKNMNEAEISKLLKFLVEEIEALEIKVKNLEK